MCRKGNCWPELVDFYHPGGAEADSKPGLLCVDFPRHAKEKPPHHAPVLMFLSTPIRVREKRMNTHTDGENIPKSPKTTQIKL
jgi:hypothetical protein